MRLRGRAVLCSDRARLPEPQSAQRLASDAGGSVLAFPYMPRVADLPRGWRHWSPAEKIEHLLGMSLDDMAEIMSWPIAELRPARSPQDR